LSGAAVDFDVAVSGATREETRFHPTARRSVGVHVMDLAEAYIFELGFVFFATWSIALAALSVIAFGRDIVSFASSKFLQPNSSLPR
jgi:hypothetical protein